MHAINESALTNLDAMPHAKRVERDVSSGLGLDAALAQRGVPPHLVADVTAILEAVSAGWFAIPRGAGWTFSKEQYSGLYRLAERAPWLQQVELEAADFEEKRLAFIPKAGYSFGVDRIPNLAHEAKNLRYRLHRLPFEHVTGKITVDLWARILLDTQAAVRHLRGKIECLSPSWMWEPTHPLNQQVERLKAYDLLHMLPQYVSTTRNRWICGVEAKLVDQVRYHGLAVEEYQAQIASHRARTAREAEEVWEANFRHIRRLASILDGVTSYHHGTLTRKVRECSQGAFTVKRSSISTRSLVVEIRPLYEVGQGYDLGTPFMLVNYCLALADEIEAIPPVFEHYLEACRRAYARVKALEEPEAGPTPAPRIRRPDDFDGAAA